MYQVSRIESLEQAVEIISSSRQMAFHDLGAVSVHVIEHPKHGAAIVHIPVAGDPYMTHR